MEREKNSVRESESEKERARGGGEREVNEDVCECQNARSPPHPAYRQPSAASPPTTSHAKREYGPVRTAPHIQRGGATEASRSKVSYERGTPPCKARHPALPLLDSPTIRNLKSWIFRTTSSISDERGHQRVRLAKWARASELSRKSASANQQPGKSHFIPLGGLVRCKARL